MPGDRARSIGGLKQWLEPAGEEEPKDDFRVVALRAVTPAIYDPSWNPTVRIVVLRVLLVVIIVLAHPAAGVCLS